MIREFLMNAPSGDFVFPALNAQKNRKQSMKTIDSMELSPTQTPQHQASLQKSPPKLSTTVNVKC